jgi:hypothetical protein
MSQVEEPSILRRRFLSIATATYDNPPWWPLPVMDEVQALHNWLCNRALADRSFSPWHSELAHDPTKDAIRQALEDPSPAERFRDADAVVLYITGHGHVEDGSHWLVLRRTERDRVRATALKTSDLFGWMLDTGVQHLLVICDLCYAGAAAKDVIRFDRPPPSGWVGITSVSAGEQAMTGALTEAIRSFLDELDLPEGQKYGSSTDPYLCVGDLLRVLQRKLSRLDPPQTLSLLTNRVPSLDLRSPCLPNPHYQSGAARVAVELARRDLALLPSDLLAHWSPKARGVPTDADPGWLFTGRRELMTRLIEFASGPPTALVVTGRAGCGKSAALARLVTLSDPTFRREHEAEVTKIPDELLPQLGAVDLAAVATGKSAAEILMQICGAVGASPATDCNLADQPTAATGPDVSGAGWRPVVALGSARAVTEAWLAGWWSWLRQQPEPVTVVVDALDEAADPFGVLTSVLQRLDLPAPEPRRLRLLLAVRSLGADNGESVGQAQGIDSSSSQAHANLADLAKQRLGGQLIRADSHPYWNAADVADYVEEILHTVDRSPYTDIQHGTMRHRLGAVIAGGVGRSFLIARIVADSLAARAFVQDPDDPQFRAVLEQGVLGVLQNDLQQSLSPADRRRAVDLLRATAYAFGRGIPWLDIWPAVATAITTNGINYEDHDIAWLLDSRLSGYLVTDQEDGITVYRPFHDSLRDALQRGWDALLAEEPK